MYLTHTTRYVALVVYDGITRGFSVHVHALRIHPKFIVYDVIVVVVDVIGFIVIPSCIVCAAPNNT